MRFLLVDIAQNKPLIFLYISASFFILVLFLVFGFTFFQKSRFLKIKIKPFPFSVDLSILSFSIQDILRKYLKNEGVSVELILLPSKKLEVVFYLSDLKEDTKEALLAWAKKEIANHLQSKYSYYKGFSLVLYYQ